MNDEKQAPEYTEELEKEIFTLKDLYSKIDAIKEDIDTIKRILLLLQEVMIDIKKNMMNKNDCNHNSELLTSKLHK